MYGINEIAQQNCFVAWSSIDVPLLLFTQGLMAVRQKTDKISAMSVFCFSKKQLSVEKKTRHPVSSPDTGRAIMCIYWKHLDTWIVQHCSDIICQIRLCFEFTGNILSVRVWLWYMYYGLSLFNLMDILQHKYMYFMIRRQGFIHQNFFMYYILFLSHY